MASFPTAIPSFTANTTNTPLSAFHPQHHDPADGLPANLIAGLTKLGTGSSTAALGTFLTATGSGASAWGNAIGSDLAIDSASWTAAQRLKTGVSLSAGTSEHNTVIQTATVVSNSIASYQKNGLSSYLFHRDPSTGGINRDGVALSGVTAIGGTNTAGRGWGLYGQIQFKAGSDGLGYGAEIGVLNQATADQADPSQPTAKIGINVPMASASTQHGTAAIRPDAAGAYKWHHILWMTTDTIGSASTDTAVQLYSPGLLGPTFAVYGDGRTLIQASLGANVPLTVRAKSGQSADLIQMQDSSLNNVVAISANGQYTMMRTQTDRDFAIKSFNTSNSGSVLTLDMSKNASITGNGVPASGEILGRFLFRANNGSGTYNAGAEIRSEMDGTASGDTPGRLSVYTTPVGANTGTLRALWDSAGQFKHSFGLTLSGVVSPTQIAADTDDYSPTSGTTNFRWRLSTDAARNITGIVAEATGTYHHLVNVGSFNITLKHNVTSTAANRFLCPGSVDFVITPNTSVFVWYDGSSSRWRVK